MSARLRVVMATQAVDAADPLLAFVVDWIRALAARVEQLHVVCYRAADADVPSNVTLSVVGDRQSGHRLARLVAFERATWAALAHADLFFAHMSPRLACWGGVAARAQRRPMLLWYVHRQVSAELRLATALSTTIATATDDSFPLATSKRHVLGHGINAAFFAPASLPARATTRRIVMVGRLSPIKQQAVLLEALPAILRAHPDATVQFVGAAPGTDGRYRDDLRSLAEQLNVSSQVLFSGALPATNVRDAYRSAEVAVNLSPAGLFDKAVLESLMCGTPTVVANPAFSALLDTAPMRLCLDEVTPGAVATAVSAVLSMTDAARGEMTDRLRVRATTTHALEPFMARLVGLMESVV